MPESKDAHGLPRNKRGAVDEWLAIEQQKQRAVQVLVQQQQQEKKAAKKIYRYRRRANLLARTWLI